MDKSRAKTPVQAVLSIGALSRATGVPTETLRTWERRYGVPKPTQRSVSGHRRYPIEVVDRIRLAVHALRLGHKPSVALRADESSLKELIGLEEMPEPPRHDPPADMPENTLDRWFHQVELFDGDGLRRGFQRAWNEQGTLTFLKESSAPFLIELGRRWETGALEVAHEHFASEKLREFLAIQWRALSERSTGARIICATPSDEQHVLGLHMAATAMATAEVEIIFLGADTPAADLAIAAKQRGANSVALSASSSSPRRHLIRFLNKLSQLLPDNVPVVTGGAGFEKISHARALLIADLEALATWARSLTSVG